MMRTRDDQARLEVLLALSDAMGNHRLMLAVGSEPVETRRARKAALRVLRRAADVERDNPTPKEWR